MFTSHKPSVLIVDDDLAILHTFRKIFERKGFTVAVASAGGEAKEKLQESTFDVALVDLCLPDMEGTDLFPTIKRSSPKTLKVLLTGKTSVLNSLEGADAYLAKPVDPRLLLSLIDTKLSYSDLE